MLILHCSTQSRAGVCLLTHKNRTLAALSWHGIYPDSVLEESLKRR